jgi:hypothetical protein
VLLLLLLLLLLSPPVIKASTFSTVTIVIWQCS